MRKWVAIGVAVALVVGACCGALVLRHTSQAGWIHTTVRILQSWPPPSPEIKLAAKGDWAVNVGDRRGYLLFVDSWAVFAAHTLHASERIGDVALLQASDGAIYISHFHFCVGLGEFSDQPQPKDLQDFLQEYGAKQQWQRLSGS